MNSGLLPLSPPPPPSLCKLCHAKTKTYSRCFSPTAAAPEIPEDDVKEFSYRRAWPSVRWPHLKLPDSDTRVPPHPPVVPFTGKENVDGGDQQNEDAGEELGSERARRSRVKKMNKLALKKANDWRGRVKFLTDRILALQPHQFVVDVLDDGKVQMTPTDFAFVVKLVGQESWQRALEVYEWLNLRHWYSPNARMLATILAILGRANQEALAVEIFARAEPSIEITVQVYNAIMGVYARNGRVNKVEELVDLMRQRGCEPDLVSFNTLINARLKAGVLEPGFAIQLLNMVRKARLRPDIITYNTLISACSRDSNLEEAVKVFDDMERHSCQPDLWTYNAMISVYGRCGMSAKAEQLFNDLEAKGFFPDAVTYNSLLYAFAREGDVHKVREICKEMVEMGFGRDGMTYNTIIHMYGKQGQVDRALQLYRDMKLSGKSPDAVTYTVLIDSLGKANMVMEASKMMSEMLDAGVNPTLQTYSALICGYAKAGMQVQAEEAFDCMVQSGIRPDCLAYSVMLDVFLRRNEIRKAMVLYHDMIGDGHLPDNTLYEEVLRVLKTENKVDYIQKVIRDMEELCNMNPQTISSILFKGNCFDDAIQMLRLGISKGCDVEKATLFSILDAYGSSGRYSEAHELLDFLKGHAKECYPLITEALVVLLCKSGELEAALEEYMNARSLSSFRGSCGMYESLLFSCKENERFAEASQLFTDMRLYSIKLSPLIFQIMVIVYCKMGLPESAQHLIGWAEIIGIGLGYSSIYVDVIEAYGKLKLWKNAETLVWNVRQRHGLADRKVLNALIQAYAASGCYEKARAIFNTMMGDGPAPTVDSINGLLEALIVDGRLNELYVVIQELQDMGFQISKSSIILMLDTFARAGNIFEVKKIYHGMKAAGYYPTMHLYRTVIGLFCRAKIVRDAEAMVSEMEEAGFKPDLTIWNSMLKLYTGTENYIKAVSVYQQMKESGLTPDEDTYNTLIIMYCRDCRPEEGLSLMYEMRNLNLSPKLDTYKSLISAFGKKQLFNQAEELFDELLVNGHKLDRSFYHTMMKIFRDSGNHSKSEKLLSMMKQAGVEPTMATMHLLLLSYGGSGQPEEAENVLNNLRETGVQLTTLPYASVIDAYLNKGDYKFAIQKLMEMKCGGLEADHRIWTCFIRAASLCHQRDEAITLLNALKDVGFDLPIRLLTEKSKSLVLEMDNFLQNIEPLEDKAAFNFVNALQDLLWAFELRATASWVFQVAIKRRIYRHDIFRVADKDWGADLRKLSAGSALVGLTLWLDHMQDASLQGYPESPKSVALISGTAEYNSVSLSSTLKACLWEMGSPFLPCKTRTGLLVAKAHSLKMWLKDSPFCMDLELKDSPSLPEVNSMQLVEGCFMRRGLVPAFKEITEKLGFVRPKKFARLALLSDDRREKAIQADIEGHKEKQEKMMHKRSGMKSRMRKFRRRPTLCKAIS